MRRRTFVSGVGTALVAVALTSAPGVHAKPLAERLANTTAFTASATAPRGKTVLAGTTAKCNDIGSCIGGALVALRLNPKGAISKNFGAHGLVKVKLALHRAIVSDIEPTPDGGHLLAYAGDRGLGIPASVLVKLTKQGTPDPSFGVNGIIPGPTDFDASDLALDSQGRIVVAGTVQTTEPTTKATVLRYLANGKLDDSFGDSGVATVSVNPDVVSQGGSVVVSGDDGVRIAGSLTTGLFFDLMVAALHEDGTPDTAFGDQGIAVLPETDPQPIGLRATSLLADEAGHLIVVARQNDGTEHACSQTRVSRLDADGTLDSSFAANGTFFSVLPGCYSATDAQLDAKGRLFLSASSDDYTGSPKASIAKLRPGGSLAKGFGAHGVATVRFPGKWTQADSVLLGDGTVLATGSTDAGACKQKKGKKPKPCQAGIAARVKARSGKRDKSFGEHGKGRFSLPSVFKPKH